MSLKKLAAYFKEPADEFSLLVEWFEKAPHPALRMHTMGIFEAERKFGYVIRFQTGKQIPTRVIAEKFLEQKYGFIPTVEHWLSHIPVESWMGYRNPAINQAVEKEIRYRT